MEKRARTDEGRLLVCLLIIICSRLVRYKSYPSLLYEDQTMGHWWWLSNGSFILDLAQGNLFQLIFLAVFDHHDPGWKQVLASAVPLISGKYFDSRSQRQIIDKSFRLLKDDTLSAKLPLCCPNMKHSWSVSSKETSCAFSNPMGHILSEILTRPGLRLKGSTWAKWEKFKHEVHF